MVFSNTYHLYLRPGPEVVAAHGGLHRFMHWERPIMTDSGGFQVFSLGASLEHGVGKIANIFPAEEGGVLSGKRPQNELKSLVTVGEDSVRFKSHIDGSEHLFTPEKSIAVQRSLGRGHHPRFRRMHLAAYTTKRIPATALSAPTAGRGAVWTTFEAHDPEHDYAQALYGIVQGGAFQNIRSESARVIAGMDFGGIAIGGNLGRTRADMYRILDWTVPELPVGKPRHLLGIGDVPSLFEAVQRGVDTFDCVSPTRNARNGGLLQTFRRRGAAGCPNSASTCETRASPPTRGPWTTPATARPVGTTREPTCATSSKRTSFWPKPWRRFTTCALWRGSARTFGRVCWTIPFRT